MVTFGPEVATHTITAEWIERALAGVLVHPEDEHVRIAPRVAEGVQSAAAVVDIELGTVESRWELVETPGDARDRDSMMLSDVIPASATGTIMIPTLGGERVRVREDGKTIWNNGNRTRPLHDGIEEVTRKDGRIVVEVSAGTYDFELKQIGTDSWNGWF